MADCGLMHITDETIRAKLKERVPEKAEEIDAIKGFGEIKE